MNSKSIFVLIACSVLAAACVSSGGARGPASDAEAARANVDLGAGYLRQQRPDLAIEALERALDIDARLAEAHSMLALAYDQSGEAELAEEHHRRATTLDPNDAEAHNRFAVFLCRQNRWADARRNFDRAINNPRYATPDMAMVNAATCARGANDPDSAERYYRDALSTNNANADALAGMAELAYQKANYLQGRAFIQRLFATSTPGPRQLLLCYSIEAALNDAAAAGDCADRLASEYPGSAELGQLRELERDGG